MQLSQYLSLQWSVEYIIVTVQMSESDCSLSTWRSWRFRHERIAQIKGCGQH